MSKEQICPDSPHADEPSRGCRAGERGRIHLRLLVTISVWISVAATAWSADCLRPQDDFYLVNARGLGGRWCANAWQRMDCHRYVASGEDACRRWIRVPIEEFYAADDSARLTLVYVHGNRVAPGDDIAETLDVYRALLRCNPHAPPLRLVAFSWPTARIRGPFRDYQYKADLADPTGLHLASFLSQLPSHTPLALVGYSYGSRVIGGALHLLAGGSLCGYALPAPANLRPARVLMISAAVHNDWLLPGRKHGRAMQLIDRLVLINNACDPAMRFYHVSSRQGHPYALGRWGVCNRAMLGEASERIYALDACRQVGKRHALQYYLGATSLMNAAGGQLLALEVPETSDDHDRVLEWELGATSGAGGEGG